MVFSTNLVLEIKKTKIDSKVRHHSLNGNKDMEHGKDMEQKYCHFWRHNIDYRKFQVPFENRKK